MKYKNLILLATTIVVSLMILLFTGMILFIGEKFASDTESATEAFLELPETKEQETVPEVVENIEELIYISDDIDLSLDDTAQRAVEEETSYINSVELLPSVYMEHEIVPKEKVSVSNFTKSFAGEESASITVEKKADEVSKASVTLPAKITLYNNSADGSGSYLLTTQITGDRSVIKNIGWSSEDSSIVQLSKTSGNSTQIMRVDDFTGMIHIGMIVTYYSGNNTTATEAFDVEVEVVDMEDEETKLYDINGVELFVDKQGKKPAYLKDYEKYTQFYGAIKTTGWQQINGKDYYFDGNGVPITGTQYIGGIEYDFDKEGVLVSNAGEKGIDVSLYQKEIDWQQVADSGITFAIIRCGFRGSRTGKLVEDVYFRKNIEGAKAAGIHVGVYFFTQAISEHEAKEEAAMVMQLCKNYTLDLPMFVDSENAVGGRANYLDQDARTRLIEVFCSELTSAGHKAGVYASKVWYYQKVHAKELEKYTIWVAQYNTECNYTGKKNYWQYSSKAQINGIVGNVDVNIAY